MSNIRGRISENGRISIPAVYRKKLGLKAGDAVVIDLIDDELRIRSVHASVRRAQELARKMIERHPEISVDDFLAERRRYWDD